MILQEPVRHILIVKLDHAGDVLWTTPALETLKNRFPSARLGYLCTPYTLPVLEGNPYIDDLLPHTGGEPYPADLPRPDLALCLDTRTPAVKLTYASRARVRTGYYYFPRGLSVLWPLGLLTHPFLHPASRGDYAHEVEVTHRLLQKLDCDEASAGETQLYFSAMEEIEARDLLGYHGYRGGLLLAAHLPLKWLDGNWPAEHVTRLMWALQASQPDATLLLSCGPGEEDLLRSIEAELPPGTFCISGQSFRAWAAILKQCHLLLCRDCGPVHVAAAMGVPVVSIFEESKRKEHTRWEPWKINHVNVFRPDRYAPPAEIVFARETIKAAQKLLKAGKSAF